MKIKELQRSDCWEMAEIYSYYILNSVYTFDKEPVTEEYMQDKISHLHGKYPLLGMVDEQGLAGYAYGSAFRDKEAYSRTVETTIYLHPERTGKGYGKTLYVELLQQLKHQDFKMAIGVLGLPNEPSEKLHRALGFTHAGNVIKVGWKFDAWQDTGYWQLDLEKWEHSSC